MTTAPPRLIEIFRAGQHVDMHGRALTFTAADLKAIADGYDPQLQQAPVVVGHPKTDDPAYAQVKRLVAKGDVLSYEEEQSDPAFDDLRKAGRFKQRSASFFLPGSPNNPTPGQYYIKHVGWLGAAAPAVPGLKPAAFAGDDRDCVEFAMDASYSDRFKWAFHTIADLFRNQREALIATDGVEKANQTLPNYQIDSIREAGNAVPASPAYADPDSPTTATATVATSTPSDEDLSVTDNAELAKKKQELDDREAAIKADEKRIADRKATERREEATSFADGLIKEGRLLPKDKAATVEVLLALPVDVPLKFSEGDTTVEKTADALLRSLLSTLPKQIDFAEKSGSANAEHSAEFAAPAGVSVSSDRMDTFNKAKAYQAQHPNVSWVDAVRAVGG